MVLDRLLGPREASREEKLLYLVGSMATGGSLRGRKKLTKLSFFADHWLPDEGMLSPEGLFAGFDFVVYEHGPFSRDLFEAFDELNDSGLLEETRRPGDPSRIRLTEHGERRLATVESCLTPRERSRIATVRDRLSGKSGDELELLSLERLGIDYSERQEYVGMPVGVLVSERS